MEVGAGMSFSSSATKGALLILPEGAKRSDHQQYTRFAEYAAKYAHSWYKYVNGPLARGVPNGALYFITGYDKARAWGVASFKNAPGKISLEFVPKFTDTPKAFPEYWFQRYDFASYDADSDVSGNQSGSVFLRGFKIALQQARNPFVPNCAKVEKILELEPEELLPSKVIQPNNARQLGLQQLWPAASRFSNSTSNHQYHTTPNNSEIENFPPRYQASLYFSC